MLTFNKTLRGYISALVNENTPAGAVEITVDTFSRWAVEALGGPKIYEDCDLDHLASKHAAEIGLPVDFLISEAVYAMGRFLPETIEDYLSCRRDGRGATPRVEKSTREKIIEKIIRPYTQLKLKARAVDWNDVAVQMSRTKFYNYDVIIVDESQDFSANQLRGILAQAGPDCATSFIIDTAQRIYAGGFTWAEVGLIIRPENSHRLNVNYRNTPEIARFAANFISCVQLDDDGTPPLLEKLSGNPKPVVITGLYSQQVSWCIQYIRENVDLQTESVAFLHPKGWFGFLKAELDEAGLPYVDLTRKSNWPKGNENVAISTLHSAKGLDFDHAIIIGLDKKSFPEGECEIGDDRFDTACRLLSMAIARARKGVVVGYKRGEEPALIHRLDPATYEDKPL